MHVVVFSAQMPDHRTEGELVIQTIAMPKDTNPNGDIFGGWLISQMDFGSRNSCRENRDKRESSLWQWKECRFSNRSRVGDTVRLLRAEWRKSAELQ